MSGRILRVGTTYIPVQDVRKSAHWYVEQLGAKLNYEDREKAILDLANQSFFLVKAEEKESGNFKDASGKIRCSLTFEVDGETALQNLQRDMKKHGVAVGEIEDRGHAGINFVFSDLDGNLFDVWSELSASFKASRG
ncbi:catechol 2,3-dioxygenase-like lactoylglutathione lyase family enzyme [Sporosarcina luteola]|nr:catechol 2,3-dioxygenase-like lactoylglutathione lyase family enzyme [Sporosarcina luteola]